MDGCLLPRLERFFFSLWGSVCPITLGRSLYIMKSASPNHSLVGIISRLDRSQGLCFANEETQSQGNDLIDFIV